jgi:hypothetical protein
MNVKISGIKSITISFGRTEEKSMPFDHPVETQHTQPSQSKANRCFENYHE